MGTARGCPRSEPGGPDRRGSSRSLAQLGLASSATARRAWQSGESGTCLGWTGRSAPAAGRTDVGCAHTRPDTAGSADMGRAASAAIFDATAAASAAGSAELGCDRRAARPCMGRASAARASRSGPDAGPAGATTASGRRAAATSADLGVATRRGSAGCGLAGTIVGCRPAGRSGP